MQGNLIDNNNSKISQLIQLISLIYLKNKLKYSKKKVFMDVKIYDYNTNNIKLKSYV